MATLEPRRRATKRFYPIADLDFRDFWDICRHFQAHHPQYRHISYTIDGFKGYICLEDDDVARILSDLAASDDQVRKFIAAFHSSSEEQDRTEGLCELQYRPTPYDRHQTGLTFFSDSISKLSLYRFEQVLYENYNLDNDSPLEIEFGTPCEVLAAVMDMRGFSAFCEQPNIESPYTCGLMSAFYNLTQDLFRRYPPDTVKFLGDGVVLLWRTTHEDRQVVVENVVPQALEMDKRWSKVRMAPHFSHGSPSDIGIGIAFGLASLLPFGDDYIGRPINVASRLCAVCPGGQVYIDKSVPDIPENLRKTEITASIRSFGRMPVWQLSATRGRTAPPIQPGAMFPVEPPKP
ncbi:MAG: adenylate/guanylate cyclase domain-containing protein [Verrucomicrobiota bacterium]